MHARDEDITAMPRARLSDEAILVARLGRRRGLAAVAQGLAAPFRGFAWPGLWRYGILPIVLNILISAAVMAGLVFGLWAALQQLHDASPGSWVGHVLAWVWFATLCLGALAAAAATWFLLQGVLCDFFYLRLARRVEMDLGLPGDHLRDIPFLHDLADTLVSLFLLVSVILLLLCLNCLPVVGTVLYAVCTFCFTCWVFGLDYLRFPLVLRGLRRQQRRELCRQHRGQSLGVGAVVLTIYWLPVINAILLTGAVVGAVLLHRDLWPLAPGRYNY
jgi:uncharacterized protein involved in cysteine biosynthesis